MYWEDYEKPAVNLKTGESVTATRRRLKTDFELPMPRAYQGFLEKIVLSAGGEVGENDH